MDAECRVDRAWCSVSTHNIIHLRHLAAAAAATTSFQFAFEEPSKALRRCFKETHLRNLRGYLPNITMNLNMFERQLSLPSLFWTIKHIVSLKRELLTIKIIQASLKLGKSKEESICLEFVSWVLISLNRSFLRSWLIIPLTERFRTIE